MEKAAETPRAMQCKGLKATAELYCNAALWRNLASSLLAQVTMDVSDKFLQRLGFLFFSIRAGTREIKGIML
jgi:hypothetical protein